jgi:2-keto-4-pentenoate hydratase/2-oxohepta-3-ene-1,7-dioic acid hydratase in catechol pathway
LRLYSYLSDREPRTSRLAAATDGPVVDLLDAWDAQRGDGAGGVMRTLFMSSKFLIAEGAGARSLVTQLVEDAAGLPDVHVELSSVRLLAPVTPSSLRDFLAFESHVTLGAQRRGAPVPEYWYRAPVYYKGNHRAIIGPDAKCPWPPYTEQLDFELELALVIGRPGNDIPAERAHEHIFGFTILNDFSARDVQADELSVWLGPAKSKDFANALGPCIVTVDEVGAEPDLAMVCRVNGEEWGVARSSDMHWSWAEIIAHVSQSENVFPGDVYGSGTPGGCCGLDLGRRLRPGDVVELEIESIGVLRNTIGAVGGGPLGGLLS